MVRVRVETFTEVETLPAGVVGRVLWAPFLLLSFPSRCSSGRSSGFRFLAMLPRPLQRLLLAVLSVHSGNGRSSGFVEHPGWRSFPHPPPFSPGTPFLFTPPRVSSSHVGSPSAHQPIFSIAAAPAGRVLLVEIPSLRPGALGSRLPSHPLLVRSRLSASSPARPLQRLLEASPRNFPRFVGQPVRWRHRLPRRRRR